MNSQSKKRLRQEISSRVVVSLDLDCFYASVAIRERPELVNEPVGVVQKKLLVTTNYVARKMGVPKMGRVDEAREQFPQLKLVDGSDLTPFRSASMEVMQTVRRFLAERCERWGKRGLHIACEKLGLDEIFIELTALVQLECENGSKVTEFCGHTRGETSEEAQKYAMMIGSRIVHDLRAEVTRVTRLTLCGGISSNKMLAKLAGNMHKPDDQTVLFQEGVSAYLYELAPRAIPGIGYALRKRLAEWSSSTGVKLETVGEMYEYFSRNVRQLERICGNPGHAQLILQWCVGEDASGVRNSGPPKTMSCEDSYAGCSNVRKLTEKLELLCASLIMRLQHDHGENGFRQPRTFRVSYRMKNSNIHRGSRSAPVPPNLICKSVFQNDATVIRTAQSFFVQTALTLLKNHANVSESSRFNIALLSVAVTNFTGSSGEGDSGSIERFLSPGGKASQSTASTATTSQLAIPQAMGHRPCVAENSKTVQENTKDATETTTTQNHERVVSVQQFLRPVTANVGVAQYGDEERARKTQKSEVAPQCPLCGRILSTSNVMQNAHIDACMKGKSTTSAAKSLPTRRTSPGARKKVETKPIESYFTRKR